VRVHHTGNFPLAHQLHAQRKTLGLTLQQLASRCAVDEDELARWEAGICSPEVDALSRWAAALGLNVALIPIEHAPQQPVIIDWQARQVRVKGTPVRLTRMEWKVLERLAAVPGTLVSHRELFDHLYQDDREEAAQANAVRVLIARLRRKLSLSIEARWGQGYIVNGIEASRPELTLGARPEPVPVVPVGVSGREPALIGAASTTLQVA
jgi:transcriptional regulator with XRE-family HTH domain